MFCSHRVAIVPIVSLLSVYHVKWKEALRFDLHVFAQKNDSKTEFLMKLWIVIFEKCHIILAKKNIFCRR